MNVSHNPKSVNKPVTHTHMRAREHILSSRIQSPTKKKKKWKLYAHCIAACVIRAWDERCETRRGRKRSKNAMVTRAENKKENLESKNDTKTVVRFIFVLILINYVVAKLISVSRHRRRRGKGATRLWQHIRRNENSLSFHSFKAKTDRRKKEKFAEKNSHILSYDVVQTNGDEDDRKRASAAGDWNGNSLYVKKVKNKNRKNKRWQKNQVWMRLDGEWAPNESL